jgi:hypothetical protein
MGPHARHQRSPGHQPAIERVYAHHATSKWSGTIT